MSSYKKYLVLLGLAFFFSACSDNISTLEVEDNKEEFKTIKSKPYVLEDQYVMFALEYENQKDFVNSRQLYKILYKKTNKLEYLLKYANLSFHLKDYNAIKGIIPVDLIKGTKQEEELLKLRIFTNLQLKKLPEALSDSKKLILINNNSINNELQGTVYLTLKEYKKSFDSFLYSYKLSNSKDALLTLSNIEYYHLENKDSAKNRLLKYIEENNYPYSVSLSLLIFYEKDKEEGKILTLLDKIYNTHKRSTNSILFSKIKVLYVKYMAKKDLNIAIDFLEKENLDDELLVDLYRDSGNISKSYDLLNRLYNKTKNMNYLAQLAITEFEMAKDKEKVLHSVISKFKESLKTLNNPVYQNYLSYILIDYDLDVKEGIVLVKKALLKEPENIAYLDTLAWGEYKIGNCKKSYDLMKKIIDKIGLEDKEIKLHWEKIKECMK